MQKQSMPVRTVTYNNGGAEHKDVKGYSLWLLLKINVLKDAEDLYIYFHVCSSIGIYHFTCALQISLNCQLFSTCKMGLIIC